MRITSPPADARVRLEDIDLADAGLYTNGDAHLAFQTLRAEQPLFWQAQDGGPGFWAVTRRSDVRHVLAEHETFTSEGGTAIAMIDAPDPAAGLMMQATDPPRHQKFRQQLGRPFSPHEVPAYARRIRSIVRDAIRPGLDGETWDAADSFSRLPMAVGAMMMRLPEPDIEPLRRLAFASLAPSDPQYSTGSEKVTASSAHYDIIEYFANCIEERRKDISEDLISHLLTIEIGGRRLTEGELLFNCLSLLLGAVVTTSQAVNAILVALMERHDGEGRWPDGWPEQGSVETMVEEALRWSSPVLHFMRRARHDVEMHGQKIRAGDAVTAWIASANRDETVFGQPYVLDLERAPNRHVAFGNGPHRCLGSHLARLMLRESFDELMTCVESFELAGAPEHLVSNEIAGMVRLPLRLKRSTASM